MGWFQKSEPSKTDEKPKLSMESLEDRLTPSIAFFPGVNSPVAVNTGSNPNAVTVADFNQDGRLDVATTNPGTNKVAILLGTGNGGFSSPIYSDVAGTAPNDLTAGDVNGDGITDLVTANATADNVSVLLGNNDGTFQPGVNYSVGNIPLFVGLLNLNGDNAPDLVVANSTSSNVSVLLNNGNGTYGAAQNITVGAVPRSMNAGDFNGDGFVDLAVANSGSNNVSILLGNGSGGFSAGATLNVGTNPASIVVADFNNDNKFDIATLNAGSANVSILLGTGGGTFSAPNNIAYSGQSPRQMTVSDFNGDGIADLTVTNETGQNIGILQGVGNGTFSGPTFLSVGGQSPVGIAIGDFNNDGKQDLVTANATNNSVYALIGYSPNATLTSSPNVIAPATSYTFTVTYTGLNAAPIKTSTLGNSNILVTGPNGFSQLATFVSVSTSGATSVATYSITPPGGVWSLNSSGTYNISVQVNQVSDTGDVFVRPGTIGNFRVSITNELNNLGVGYVNGLYQSILGRTGDAAGLKYWNDLLNGGAAKDTLFTGFWVSVEHRTLQVRSYYQQYLNREADQVGLSFWVAKFAQGATESDVITAFMNSNEYKNIHGGTPAGVIGAIYNNLLGRDATASEIQIWTNTFLKDGSGAVAKNVINSVEYQLDLAKEDYIAFLNRPLVAQSEIDAFTYTATSKGPFGEQQIAQSFATSSEFINLTLETLPT